MFHIKDEEFIRGTAAELQEQLAKRKELKGEIVVVVERKECIKTEKKYEMKDRE